MKKNNKIESEADIQKITEKDLEWIFVLFGCAIGGILYLPMQAAGSGMVAVIIGTILVFPVMYFAQRGLAAIVMHGDRNNDITQVLENNLGKFLCLFWTVVYLLSCYTVLLAFTISLPNSLAKLFVTFNIGSMDLIHNIWFSFAILFVLIGIMIVNEKFMLKLVTVITYSLLIMIFLVSVILIPYWNLAFIKNSFDLNLLEVFKGIVMFIPLIVFGMNFNQSVSDMSVHYKKEIDDIEAGTKKVNKNIKIGLILIILFTMFFVYSSMFALSGENMYMATKENYDIFTLIGIVFSNRFLKYCGPIIAVLSVSVSFLGVYLGAREAVNGLFRQILTFKNSDRVIDNNKINKFTILFIFITLWITAICNFNIINLLGIITAPAIGLTIFFLPLFMIYKVDKYNKFKNKKMTIFMSITGIIVLFGFLFGMML